MRILMISQWFDPEPTFKGLAFARALAERGHKVQVLTGFPNYPGGKLYDGYRLRILRREDIDGIQILRVPLYPSHDKSALRRILNYLTFALSAAVIGTLTVKQADVIYAYHPPGTIAIPVLAISLLRGAPFVYDVQDLWPDTLGVTGMVQNHILLAFVDKWCRMVYRSARKIVVLSPGFKGLLVARGVPEDRIEVIYNWCDEVQMKHESRNEALAKQLGLSGRFNIVFSGTMGRAQALDAALDAAGLLQSRLPVVQFVFVGGGIDVDRLRSIAEKKELTNVVFFPPRPFSKIGEILSLADVLLVHLKDDPLFRVTIPSKTQAYLAAGRPILVAVGGDAEELVRRAKAGISCVPESPESIAEAVEELFRMPRNLLEEMGDNGRRFYERELALSVGVTRFEAIFHAAAANV